MRTYLDSHHPDFFTLLEQALKEYEEVEVSSFICKDWTVHYNLYNPENFEDPDNPPEWYAVEDVYDYYEKPYTNPNKSLMFWEGKIIDLSAFKNLVKQAKPIEQEILDRLVDYTFGNAGAYAAGVHYDYAKKTIEQRHQKAYTKASFLKHNLCLDTIQLMEEESILSLHFDCSWDEEHGLDIKLEAGKIISIE